MSGNPLSSEPQYRRRVVQVLPQLTQLDDACEPLGLAVMTYVVCTHQNSVVHVRASIMLELVCMTCMVVLVS